jgi:hypothetical protein
MDVSTHRFRSQLPQVRKSIFHVPCVLNLDPQVVFMPFVLLRQIRRMLEIPCLPAHSDCCIQIERQLIWIPRVSSGLCLDEAIQAIDVLELGVGVQEECRVVGIGDAESVQLLQVGN